MFLFIKRNVFGVLTPCECQFFTVKIDNFQDDPIDVSATTRALVLQMNFDTLNALGLPKLTHFFRCTEGLVHRGN